MLGRSGLWQAQVLLVDFSGGEPILIVEVPGVGPILIGEVPVVRQLSVVRH